MYLLHEALARERSRELQRRGREISAVREEVARQRRHRRAHGLRGRDRRADFTLAR